MVQQQEHTAPLGQRGMQAASVRAPACHVCWMAWLVVVEPDVMGGGVCRCPWCERSVATCARCPACITTTTARANAALSALARH